MLERFRIGTRLAIGFGTLIVATTLAFVAAIVVGLRGQADTEQTEATTRQRLLLVHSMQESQLRLVSAIRSAGLQAEGEALNHEVDEYRAALKALLKGEEAFAALPLGDEERRVLAVASDLRKQAEPVVDEAIKFTMAFAGDQAAKVLTEKFAPLQTRWAAQLTQLAAMQDTLATQATAQIQAGNHQRILQIGRVHV